MKEMMIALIGFLSMPLSVFASNEIANLEASCEIKFTNFTTQITHTVLRTGVFEIDDKNEFLLKFQRSFSVPMGEASQLPGPSNRSAYNGEIEYKIKNDTHEVAMVRGQIVLRGPAMKVLTAQAYGSNSVTVLNEAGQLEVKCSHL